MKFRWCCLWNRQQIVISQTLLFFARIKFLLNLIIFKFYSLKSLEVENFSKFLIIQKTKISSRDVSFIFSQAIKGIQQF